MKQKKPAYKYFVLALLMFGILGLVGLGNVPPAAAVISPDGGSSATACSNVLSVTSGEVLIVSFSGNQGTISDSKGNSFTQVLNGGYPADPQVWYTTLGSSGVDTVTISGTGGFCFYLNLLQVSGLGSSYVVTSAFQYANGNIANYYIGSGTPWGGNAFLYGAYLFFTNSFNTQIFAGSGFTSLGYLHTGVYVGYAEYESYSSGSGSTIWPASSDYTSSQFFGTGVIFYIPVKYHSCAKELAQE